jgi:hypothetical protein
MEPSVLRTVAETLAGLGAIGVLAATANLFALRGIGIEEVPGCLRPRVLWWGAHTRAILVASAAMTLASLVALVATGGF